MNVAEQYIDDVLNDRIVYNRYVRLAVDRHLTMLAEAKERGIYFDREAASFALDMISIMRHTKGEFAGEFFRLAGWQGFMIWVIFGWKRLDNGYRLINKAYIEVAKKNGKTELAAAIAVLMGFFDNEFGAEVYIGATKRAQSGICFQAIKQMVKFLRKDSDYVRQLIDEPQTWNIHSKKTSSKIEPLAKDAKGDQGINAHCGIIDEYHVHPDTEVHDNIESSMVSRTQPLDFVITTAGMNMNSDCYRLRTTCTQILEGILEDDSMFCMIFCFDEGDNWEDQSLWQKPIPNLNVSVKLENIISQYTKAKNEGSSKLRSFKTLNLNMWSASNLDTWVNDEEWKGTVEDFDKEDLKGRIGFGGIDMAATSDIAVYSVFFPSIERGEAMKNVMTLFNSNASQYEKDFAFDYLKKFTSFKDIHENSTLEEIQKAYSAAIEPLPKHRFIRKYYVPGEAIDEKEKRDKVRYRDWEADGWFTLIPSNVILSEAGRIIMKNDIIKSIEYYDIHAIGFDRWNAFGLVSDLTEEGVSEETLLPFGMGYKSMTTPMKSYGDWIREKQVQNLKDPVIRWMVSNCIAATDGENIKPDRKNSKGKIDGVVADIIAIGQYLVWAANKTSNKSIYDRDELWDE